MKFAASKQHLMNKLLKRNNHSKKELSTNANKNKLTIKIQYKDQKEENQLAENKVLKLHLIH